MSETSRAPFLLFIGILPVLALLFAMGGCGGRNASTQSETAPPPIHRVVVVGFEAAISEGNSPDMFRNPVTGAALMSYPVPDFAVEGLTRELFDMVVAEKAWEFIPPGQAAGVIESVLSSDTKVGIPQREMLEEVGKTFGADAVLSGVIYRWREREGTAYAVQKPASVAFDLYLIDPQDGSLLWRRNFNKAQQSLFENLFDFSTYVESSGQWLTAGKLALIGLKKMVSEMPGKSEPSKK